MVEATEPKPEESSKYNEAAMQIMRLHNLWVKIEGCVSEGELFKWQHLLDSVWRELRADVNHLKKEVTTKKIMMNKYHKLKVLIAASNTRTEWNKTLNERHEFLKQLQDEVGKGGIFEDSSEKDYE